MKPDLLLRVLLPVMALLLTNAQIAHAGCNDRRAPGMDWSGCKKANRMLDESDFTGSRFDDANLYRSDLDKSDFTSASLVKTDMTRASAKQARFVEADMTKAVVQVAVASMWRCSSMSPVATVSA